MGNGLKLEVASLRGDLGLLNLPPTLWNAIETGFDSISALELKRTEDFSVVAKVEKRLVDYEEASSLLISIQSESGAMSEANIKEDLQEPKEAKDEGSEFARKAFENFNSDNRPSALDGKRSGNS